MAGGCLREKVSVASVDQNAVIELAAALNVSPEIATILVARGLTTYDLCKRFFRPDTSHFHNPFCLCGIERAVTRIRTAVDKKERITVYGDYDVDGITATAVVIRALRSLGARIDFYLPNRLTEGYGLSREGVEEVLSRGTTLMITVDCGIGSREEIALAAERGCDVIVTDHHEPHDELPRAYAVCNPKLGDYPDPHIAGVGVALKLCQGIAAAAGLDETYWRNFLDLVALGTAADIVPLTGENRVVTHLGFTQMANTRNAGLRELIVQQDLADRDISTAQVVFQLAPCINAAGRLGDPTRGVKLLLTEDPAEAQLYARELREANGKRRALDKQVQEQAIARVVDSCDPAREHALVAADPNWHVGVIGISASKLVERFYRPTFLFGGVENGLARGSGRSVPGLHLMEVLNECADLLESYGGHAAAAGATIRMENVQAFRRRFGEEVSKRLPLDKMVPQVKADAVVTMAGLTPKFYRIVKQMEPFGPGNMRPVLLCRGLRNRYPPRIVGKGHLKLAVAADGRVMDAVGFNFGDRLSDLADASRYSLAFTLDENEWKGKVSLQMKVKGIAV
ncbi:MAG: single-stranded-DNA-specific exonuclease RecJ [Chitinivibrionales bacterium]|nr:single-stranded-DNA-specific exonuclease RecJ [Chitinivibrionales bacterium]MBD3358840.1 single-stranded-DNA-specific exonuclease RecJ [Chitinivibrionales bacterium]